MRFWRNRPAAVLCLLTVWPAAGDEPGPRFPEREQFQYAIEWRLFTAGSARLEWTSGQHGVDTQLFVQSAGLVSALYRVNNRYAAHADEALCTASTFLTAEEGRRRRETRVTFQRPSATADYLERDTARNVTILAKQIETPPCVMDVMGALYRLRGMPLAVGQATEVPVSDGKKAVMARLEAQQKETVKTPAGEFVTVRYEAFLFNDVLYKRSGRVFVWITDDGRRLPVQVQIRLQFHIGTITAQLEKYET
jgi:hypothetical protein